MTENRLIRATATAAIAFGTMYCGFNWYTDWLEKDPTIDDCDIGDLEGRNVVGLPTGCQDMASFMSSREVIIREVDESGRASNYTMHKEYSVPTQDQLEARFRAYQNRDNEDERKMILGLSVAMSLVVAYTKGQHDKLKAQAAAADALDDESASADTMK